MASPRTLAVIGAGMAGITCARTLMQAGHTVRLFEQSDAPGGRMAAFDSPFGSFDCGAQYFTVRDPRFVRALETVPGLCKRWSASSVRVLDAHGRVAEAALPTPDPHWVASPSMAALPQAWAAPLASSGSLLLGVSVEAIERDAVNPKRWQLRTSGRAGAHQVHAGFDQVLLALPHAPAQILLSTLKHKAFLKALQPVRVDPCWTLMLAFPQASQPGLVSLGPQWNAAFSSHHRVAWLARESSKPGRAAIERWTVQASPAWSAEHWVDTPERVSAKLTKAFSEVTGIRAEPGYSEIVAWPEAKTAAPLGRSHLWDAQQGIGVAGDWCLGHRVEDAFVSGLELALAVA